VIFSVKVDGQEVLRTPVCRGGEPPRAISLPLTNATMLELVVSDAGDGISYDQADWADAKAILNDGTTIWLGAAVKAGARRSTASVADGCSSLNATAPKLVGA